MSSKTWGLVSPNHVMKYDYRFLKLLVQYVMKDGKKLLAERLVVKAFERAVQDLEMVDKGHESIISRMETNMLCRIDFLYRRVGSRTHKIPHMIDDDRAYRKSLKQFKKLVPYRGQPYWTSLAREMVNLYRGTGPMVNHKVNLYKEAYANRMYMYLIRGFKIRYPETFNVVYTPELIQD